MAKDYFDRYIWLIDTVRSHPYMSRGEISRLWALSPLNLGKEGGIPERTFHNHLDAIRETFGIEILCERTRGYYIRDDGTDGDRAMRTQLFETISLCNQVRECPSLRGRILVGDIPSGNEHLRTVISCMREGVAVELTPPRSPGEEDPSPLTFHPYGLKVFRGCWYVLGRSVSTGNPEAYPLDAFTGAAMSSVPLDRAGDFDAEGFFRDRFGVEAGGDGAPVVVMLGVSLPMAPLLESRPLHHSQRLCEKTHARAVFSLLLVPTGQFKAELLSRGADIEVLSPASLRDEIADEVMKMARLYGCR